MGRIYQRTLHAREEYWHSSAWLALLSDFEDVPRRKKINILSTMCQGTALATITYLI